MHSNSWLLNVHTLISTICDVQFLFLIFFGCTSINVLDVLAQTEITGDYYEKYYGSQLQTTFQHAPSVSSIRCCLLCSMTTDCETVTYKSSSGDCYLTTTPPVAIPIDAVVSTDWDVYFKVKGIVLVVTPFLIIPFLHCLSVLACLQPLQLFDIFDICSKPQNWSRTSS